MFGRPDLPDRLIYSELASDGTSFLGEEGVPQELVAELGDEEVRGPVAGQRGVLDDVGAHDFPLGVATRRRMSRACSHVPPPGSGVPVPGTSEPSKKSTSNVT